MSVLNQSSDIKKQRALSRISEAVLTTQTYLLTDSGQAKRLAWKARRQQVMFRQGNYLADVLALGSLEIRLVRLSSESIDLDGVNAAPTGSFETEPHPT